MTLVVTHNFCEEDYAWSPVIAEFWNTVSMLPWLILALVGCLGPQAADGSELSTDARVAFVLSLAVAVGSAFFHATMARWGQVADELPMLLLGWWGVHLVGAYLASAGVVPGGRWPHRAARVAVCAGAAATVRVYLGASDYGVFLTIFISVVGTCFAALLFHVLRPRAWAAPPQGIQRKGSAAEAAQREAARLAAVRHGACWMAVSFVAWSAEFWGGLCTDPITLHSLWHVGVGVAQFELIRGIGGTIAAARLLRKQKAA